MMAPVQIYNFIIWWLAFSFVCSQEHSFSKVSSETSKANSDFTCEVSQQGEIITVKKRFSATNFTLSLKPPIESELFLNNKAVLEVVVSGDLHKRVEEASVSCKVNNIPVNTSEIGNTTFSQDISQFVRIDKITVDLTKWFDGETVTCSLRDKENNREIMREIRFDKGDGQKPTVVIYRPDYVNSDTVSLVCAVSSPKLGHVYIMWKLGHKPYISGSTSAPIRQRDSTTVLSILTISKQDYEDPRNIISCAVKHASMNHLGAPLQVTATLSKEQECSIY